MATKLIFEQNIEGFSLNEMYGLSQQSISPPPFLLEVGNTYKVVWDGVEYEVVGIDVSSLIEGMVAVGNGTAFGFTGNNEPFIIGTLESDANFFSFDTETSHTVAIYQVVSSGLVLKDRNGNDLESIDGATEMRVPTADGGFRSFLSSTRVSTTIDPDFSGYKDMVVTPNEGEVFKEVTILRPAELVPENIVKDKVIAGIVGVNEGSSSGDEFLSLIDGSIEEASGDFESIRPNAFRGCSKLTTVRAPNVRVVSESAFENCTSLTTIEGNGITEIGKNGFYKCSALVDIDVSNVQKVGDYAFYGCSSLKKIDFGTSLNSAIGSGAFRDMIIDVIIRNTTMIPDGSTEYGYIFSRSDSRLFVPRALVSTWQASNYMKLYHADKVYAIEDYPDICG